MEVVGNASVTVDGVVVTTRGSAASVAASPGRRTVAVGRMRGGEAVDGLLAGADLRIAASVDLAVRVGPTPTVGRGSATTSPTDDGPPVVVLSPPTLEPDEDACVALVEEDGELRWVFATRGEFVVEIDEDPAFERGVGTIVRKAVRFVAVKAIGAAARHGVRSLAAVAEQRLRPSRVRRFTLENFRGPEAEPPAGRELATGPILLFLHGTFSRTDHAFGNLPDELVRPLCERYEGRVIGFDHPTLSVGPDVNADDLATWLTAEIGPHLDDATAPIDIIAHSRGGLVARELASALDDRIVVRSIVFVATPNNGTPLCDSEHLGDLVDAFTNFAAVVPDNPVTDTLEVVVGLVKDLALGVVLDALPGLMAMAPDGPYLTELNRRELPGVRYRAIAADFEPRSSSAMLVRLRDRLFDRVFDGAMNDLVVPTRSAYLQRERFAVPADHRLVLDSSYGVEHAGYWSDRTVVGLLDRWLDPHRADPAPTDPATSDAEAEIEHALASADSARLTSAMDGLRQLADRFQDQVVRIVGGPVALPPSSGGAAGSVVIVPGIMGSLLATHRRSNGHGEADGDAEHVWISPWRLARGAFADLEHTDDAPRVVANGLNNVYAPLAARLAQEWNVHLFPFDWRLDIDESADRLDAFIRERRGGRRSEPVHLVAHSMGGLVARRFAARHPSTWRDIDARDHADGGRLVMLGTPHRGSYAVPLAFAGQDALAKGLAAIDLRHDRSEIGRIVASFPGMYQMLPTPFPWPGQDEVDDDRARLYETGGWPVDAIDAGLLERARAFHRELDAGHDDAIAERMVSVVGDRELTPANLRIDRGEQHYGRVDRGDGRVLHRSSVLDGVTTHYVPAAHGDLVAETSVLEAIDGLLRHGRSDLLATAPMPRRGDPEGALGGGRLAAPDVDPEPVVLSLRREVGSSRPTGAELDDALGQSLAPYLGRVGEDRKRRRSLRVKVTHASLEQASHPVIVGHYRGLPPQGAEDFLDRRLDGALGRHHELDDYPREVGESIIVESSGRPPGGIVIGLGPFGELTRSKLVRSVRTAIVKRVLRVADTGHPASLGVTSVLISTPGQYGLSTATAVAAIVEGAAGAIVALDRLELEHVVLEELELIELYEVRATRALEHLRTVRQRLPLELQEAIDLHVVDRLAIGRGGRPGMPMAADAAHGWPRFVVDRLPPTRGTGGSHDGESVRPGERLSDFPRFEFTRVGRGAQVDRLTVEFDDRKVTAMIDAAIHDPEATDAATALFEMLFPHREKLEIDDTDNLHLLVDEDSAAIPWELLCGRGGGHPAQALAMRSGMLRQIRSSAGGPPVRRSGRPPLGLRALVVGDPPAGERLPRLFGAREEARAVTRRLRDAGYDVESLVFDDDDDPATAWREVQQALYRQPYRVIHFATHGEVDTERPERTGLVIGPDQRLTALDFQQMSATPDFAFLNACHVGRLDGATTGTDRRDRMNVLAAHLGLQLMRNGVRAVAAAGWAVDDRAALMFADTLYELLLDGRHYGDAVHRARVATFDGGRTNTWGAYQCYGDPSFFLQYRPAPVSRAMPVSAGQLIEMLDVYTSKAGDVTDVESLTQTHAEVVALEERALDRFPEAEVFEAFGETYAALGCYSAAVWAFREAIARDASTRRLTRRALEQLGNMEVYLALDAHAGRPEPFSVHHPCDDSVADLFRSAQERVEGVLATGGTHECHVVLGSLHKKRATTIDDRTERLAHIDRSLGHYRAAFALDLRHRHRIDSYAGLAWAQLAHIRDRIAGGDRAVRELERAIERDVVALIAREYRTSRRFADISPGLIAALTDLAAAVAVPRARATAAVRSAHEDVRDLLPPDLGEELADTAIMRALDPTAPPVDFWTDILAGDIELTLVVTHPSLASAEAEVAIDHVGQRYLDAFANRSTVRGRLSVTQHVADLAELTPSTGGGADRADLRALLHGLAQRLAAG